jgi:hypothetical protein
VRGFPGGFSANRMPMGIPPKQTARQCSPAISVGTARAKVPARRANGGSASQGAARPRQECRWAGPDLVE